MKSTVSVIIPCFNSARFVAEAVNSVLKQTRPPDEIIVVDDGSTDDTSDVLNRFKGQISYIRQENRGPSTARNTGIQAATGELICFLDADDIWLPEKLERQLDFMTENLDVGLLFTDEEEIEAASGRVLQPSLLSSRKRFERPSLPGYVSNAVEQLLLENFIPTSTVMTRRSCLKVSGLFDEKLQVSEDRDLWTRLAANFPVAVLPEVLAVKRVHSDNISSNQELTLRCRIHLWKKTRNQLAGRVPPAIVNALLAKAHLHLALCLLNKGRRAEARRQAVQSLSFAVRRCMARGAGLTEPYPWWLGISVLPASFVGARRSFRLKRFFTSTSLSKTSKSERTV